MEEALIKRVLPHSIEAEQAVIGAMLMDKEAILTSSEIISGEDFYQSAYGILFETIVELFNEGKPVDLITLQNRLREKGCPGRGQQSGICKGSVKRGTDICECKILRRDCIRESDAASTD